MRAYCTSDRSISIYHTYQYVYAQCSFIHSCLHHQMSLSWLLTTLTSSCTQSLHLIRTSVCSLQIDDPHTSHFLVVLRSSLRGHMRQRRLRSSELVGEDTSAVSPERREASNIRRRLPEGCCARSRA